MATNDHSHGGGWSLSKAKKSNITQEVYSPNSDEPTTSSSISRSMRYLILACFLISLAGHSFAGTRYRSKIARDGDASLRGGNHLLDTVAVPEQTTFVGVEEHSNPVYNHNNIGVPSAYHKNIFYNAYSSLYKSAKGDKSYHSRMLAEAEGEHGDHGTATEEELHHELSIEVSFEDTYKILVFLGVVFLFGELAEFCGVPGLVGQIIAGFLLGPPLAKYVPFPEAMVLLGDLGLILLLVEAGIELDVGLVKEAGIRPILIAVSGSILAFGIGMGIAFGQGQGVKSAIAAGACFAPTSLGVAANALSGGKALNTPVGQLIVASAVIDDVIGLIILSMLDVLVADAPPIYEYFIPIISACGYLVVLGLSAITWIPYVVEHKILPRFKPDHRQYVAFALLYLLIMAYLPMMYYSRASHLTGAFLAGLSFSQVEGVHHTFITEAGSIMEWLLRIFFSASIGFQVPITMFGNATVVAWGFAFYTAVLGKLPVGLFAPKYDEKLPDDYPFNPYTRDVTVTSVAMTCRGEFSFIIAAFGIGEALLDEELYAAIIFAVLLSSISSPIFLTLVLKHYNKLAAKYLEQEQLDQSMVGGKAPLHVNIQIRSNLVPGMQTSIKNCCNSLGLFVIDQRNWQPRGLGVVVATELYAVDGKLKVDVNKSVKKVESMEYPPSSPKGENLEGGRVTFDAADPTVIPEEVPGSDPVSQRCEEIRQALISHPDLQDANVKVLQWVPLLDAKNKKTEASRDELIVGEVATALKNKETIDTLLDDKPTPMRVKRTRMASVPASYQDAEKGRRKEAEAEEARGGFGETLQPLEEAVPVTQPVTQQEGVRRRPRRVRMVSTPAVGGTNLWEEDTKAQDAAVAGAPSRPVQYDLQSGIRYGVVRRQRMPSDLGSISEYAPTIEERLGGIVRHSLEEPPASTYNANDLKSFFSRGSSGRF